MIGGACIELGDDELPFAPLIGALRPLAREQSTPCSPRSRTRAAPSSPAWCRSSARRPADSDGDRGDSQRLFDAVLELIAALGEESPRGVLLWIEDIHWADSSTRSLLRFLAASARDEPLMTVVTYRSDELHRRHPLLPLLAELERTPRAIRVELSRFDRDELTDQLTDILGEAPQPEIVSRMHARSDGNPLFTEELLAAGADGRGGLPPSLREALLLRVERLPDQSQQLIRLLAVIGRAGHDLLAEAAAVDPVALSAAMRETIDAQIVITDGEGRFTFRHALLREVLYDDLLPGERADLHLKLAQALERMRGGHDEAWIVTGSAHHYNAAGDQPAALQVAVEAAEAVSRLQAYHEAAALLDRAVAFWPRVADAEEIAGIDEGELLARCARAHYLWGDDEVAVGLYERALEKLDAGADPERVAMSLYRLAACEWSLGRAERSRETQRRGLDLLTDAVTSPARAQLLAQKVRFLLLQGRYREVVEEAPSALEAIDLSGYEHARAGVVNRLGLALFALGDEEEGHARIKESIALAEASGLTDDLAMVYLNYADALLLSGHSRAALDWPSRGSPRSRRRSTSVPSCARSLDQDQHGGDLLRPRRVGAERRTNSMPPASGVTGIGLASAKLQQAQLILGRDADHELARDEIDAACELLRDSLEPQYIAMHRRSRPSSSDVRDGSIARGLRPHEGIDRIQFCSEDAARLAIIATAGLAAEADLAVHACDLGDDDSCDDARDRARFLAEMVEAAAEESPRPVEMAYAAQAQAELARALGDPDPAALGRSGFRLAGARASVRPRDRALAQGAGRTRAHGALGGCRLAHRGRGSAREIGSRWLIDEVEGLASRGPPQPSSRRVACRR